MSFTDPQARWEPIKALAAILAAAAVITIAGLTLANWNSEPQLIVVRFEQPLRVQLVP